MTADFNFPCPACGQPVQANTQDRGSNAKCPACQRDVVVPHQDVATRPDRSKGQHSIAPPKQAQAAPRATGPVSTPPPPPPPPMCRLAVVAFWLSLSSLLIWPFGFIPGIICAHKAKAELSRNPKLGGRNPARLALAMGYAFAVIFSAAVVLIVLHFKESGTFLGRGKEIVETSQPVQPPETNVPPIVEPIQTGAGWTLTLTNMSIPPSPVVGKIHGKDFQPTQIGAGYDVFGLHHGTSFPHDLSVFLFFRQQPGDSLSGKQFEVSADGDSTLREVRIGWIEGEDKKVWHHFTNGYALKLEFGPVITNTATGTNTMTGGIYLCLPDTNFSYIAGTFDARVSYRRPPPVAKPSPPKGGQPSTQPGAPPAPKKAKKPKRR